MKTIYTTILGLTLVSGSAFAAVSNPIPDDDASIMNLGKSTSEATCPMHERNHASLTQVIDDDASIAEIGMTGQHVAHRADVEAALFLEDDLSL